MISALFKKIRRYPIKVISKIKTLKHFLSLDGNHGKFSTIGFNGAHAQYYTSLLNMLQNLPMTNIKERIWWWHFYFHTSQGAKISIFLIWRPFSILPVSCCVSVQCSMVLMFRPPLESWLKCVIKTSASAVRVKSSSSWFHYTKTLKQFLFCEWQISKWGTKFCTFAKDDDADCEMSSP